MTAIQAVISEGIDRWYPDRSPTDPPPRLVAFALGRGETSHPAGLYEVTGGEGYEAAAPVEQLTVKIITGNELVLGVQIYFAGFSFLLWMSEEHSCPWTDAVHQYHSHGFSWGEPGNRVRLAFVWR